MDLSIFRIGAIDREAPVSGEEYTWDKHRWREEPSGAHSESVAVVPVLIDCQGDWVSRIYLAYARTTLRNDAKAYCSTRASEIIRAVYVHDYVLSCENKFIDGLSDFPF